MRFSAKKTGLHRRGGRTHPHQRTAALLAVALTTTVLVVNPFSNLSRALADPAATAMVELGSAASFSVLAGPDLGTDATLSTTTKVDGNVGAGGDLVSSEARFGGAQHPKNDSADQQAQTYLAAAYKDARSRAHTGSLVADFQGLTLTHGVYDAVDGAAFSMTAEKTMTLDGQGDANAVFIIRTPAALTIGASSTIALINGAQASRVFWVLGAAATIGAKATLPGTIMSQAAITTGAGVTLTGRALSLHAAVTLDSTTVTSLAGAVVATTSGVTAGCLGVQPPLISLGRAATFAVLASAAVTTGAATAGTASASSSVVGDVGAGAGVTLGAHSTVVGNVDAGAAATLGDTASITGTLQAGTDVSLGANSRVTGAVTAHGSISGDSRSAGSEDSGAIVSNSDVADALASGQTAYSKVTSQSASALLTNLDERTFFGGVYRTSNPVTLSASAVVTLDGQYDVNSVFVFETSSYLTAGASSAIKLINGAQASHVLWVTGSYITLGDSATFVGDLLSSAAIDLGANASFRGHAVALGGAVTTGANATITVASAPQAVSICLAPQVAAVELGAAAPFSILAPAVTLTGAAATVTVSGDVGVGPHSTIPTRLSIAGGEHHNDSDYAQGQVALGVAFADVAGRTATSALPTPALDGLTLTGGVYAAAGGLTLASGAVITLDGNGDPSSEFIFQSAGALDLGANSTVTLINGALPSHVVWQVGSIGAPAAVTVGAGSAFTGTIVASGDITFTGSVPTSASTLSGRALSLGGTVNFADVSVTTPVVPPAAPASASATVPDGTAAATVVWPAATTTGGSAITGYNIVSSPACGSCGGLTAGPSSTSTSVTGLSAATSYSFSVATENAVGVSFPSAASNAVVVPATPPITSSTPVAPPVTSGTPVMPVAGGPNQPTPGSPGAPTAALAVASATSMLVSWLPPLATGLSPITSYTIVPSPACAPCLGLTTGGTTLASAVTGLAPGQTYTFSITATNAAGRSLASMSSPPTTSMTAGFTGITPTRMLDTRIGTGGAQSQLGAGQELTVTVPNAPTTATSIAVNVTVTGSNAGSFLTVYPTGGPRPTASNVNFTPGQTVPNLVLVPLGPDNKVSIYNNAGSVDVVADVLGYYAPGVGGGFTGVSPTRVLDTRSGNGAAVAPLGAGQELTLSVPNLPVGATAVAFNVTVTTPDTDSFVTAYPAGSVRPLASNLNFIRGQTVPNVVFVPVGVGNTVTFYNNAGSVDVVADVLGYFAPLSGVGFLGTTPSRIVDSRSGTGAAQAMISGGQTLTVALAGLPAGATAVALNITATNATGDSFLTVFPAGGQTPFASNLNFKPGQTVSNVVVVPVGPGNTVSFYNNVGLVDIVADLQGTYQ